jgi:hypothetical protein
VDIVVSDESSLGDKISDVFNSGLPLEIECIQTNHARQKDFGLPACPEFSNGNAVKSVLAVSRDITAIKEAGDALRLAKEAPEPANAEKRQVFLNYCTRFKKRHLAGLSGSQGLWQTTLKT